MHDKAAALRPFAAGVACGQREPVVTCGSSRDCRIPAISARHARWGAEGSFL